jgi:hypothetical protein
MSNALKFIAIVGWLFLGVAASPRSAAQTTASGMEQQLRAQYPITLVGNNGVVTQNGSVLVVQQDGITALPAPWEWPCNTYKQNGRIKQAGGCNFNYLQAKRKSRAFQVGEKVYLVAIQAKPAEVVFKVQSIADAANDAPFKADVSFQFEKGYLDSVKLKDVENTVSQIFVPDTSGAGARTEPPATTAAPKTPEPAPVASLTLPVLFVCDKTPADRLQLNADKSLSLTEAGQNYHGTFVLNGNALELNLTETGTKTNATIQGKQLTDSSGQLWTLKDQSAVSPPPQNVLQNQDVIELVKNGIDDATILATIANSKCQFDTSTSALIKLKQSKVSPAVLKAMVAAPK